MRHGLLGQSSLPDLWVIESGGACLSRQAPLLYVMRRGGVGGEDLA
jgi:hypothetical protein